MTDDEKGYAYSAIATDSEIKDICSMPEGEDTRSAWQWLTLPNGDVVLACFPCGDTFERLLQSGAFTR